MEINNYIIKTNKITVPKKIVMLSDLHNESYDGIVNSVGDVNPDFITVVGDIVDRHKKTYSRGLGFLSALNRVAPTYFSYGNHEVKFNVLTPDRIEKTGTILLDNDYQLNGEIFIGGQTPLASFNWLNEFEREDGFKLLLCHHPEYYKKYIKERDIDLVFSGHAHGGQWRPFGVPLFAPGQGLLPRYTSGCYENRLIVGRGLSDARMVPRLFNSIEIVVVELQPK
ncbi:MAG: metallophosphoesterase [Oscillospiraceae bacterium]